MLWYKAWLETRSRFLVSLTGAVGLCSNVVLHGDRDAVSFSRAEYYYRVLASGHIVLVVMWIMGVTLLMMGGLLREKASGASSFTLALPVSRARLMGVGIGMGVLQAVALGVVPWCAMMLIGSTVGRTHSFSQAVFYLALLLGGGSLFLAIAFLVSSLIEGEYTAPLVSFGIVVTLALSFNSERLHLYNPWGLMTGLRYIDERTALLAAPFPSAAIGGTLLIATVLLVIAVKAMERREF